MKSIYFTIIFSILLFPSLAINLQGDMKTCVDLCMNQEYDKALNLCEEIHSLYPKHAESYYLKALILEARMVDYESVKDEEDFYRACSSYEEILTLSIDNKSQDAFDYYMLGSIRAIKAGHKFRFSEYLSGFIIFGLVFIQ